MSLSEIGSEGKSERGNERERERVGEVVFESVRECFVCVLVCGCVAMWVCCKDIEDLKTHHTCELRVTVCAKREGVSESIHDFAGEQTSTRQTSELTQQCDV